MKFKNNQIEIIYTNLTADFTELNSYVYTWISNPNYDNSLAIILSCVMKVVRMNPDTTEVFFTFEMRPVRRSVMTSADQYSIKELSSFFIGNAILDDGFPTAITLDIFSETSM